MIYGKNVQIRVIKVPLKHLFTPICFKILQQSITYQI
jgi:hypothetical protein